MGSTKHALSDAGEHQDFLELSRTIQDISHGQLKKDDDSNGSATRSSQPGRTPAHEDDHARANVPHYLCETSYKKDRLFRVLYALSVLINAAYFAVRIAYIVTGRVKVTAAIDANDKELSRVARQNDAALIYSILVLVAELGGFVLVHLGQQMFTRQRTNFTTMTDDNVARMRTVCEARGKLQHIHCIVCTYSEAAATVELCVQRLLDAALPVYADLTVYVADDGHAKPEGPRKRAFVERMRAEGRRVVYIGDRVRRAGQLNGKSANLNHVILQKIYPHVTAAAQISWKDVLMVMDCDHLVKPAYFQKSCAVLLDKDVAVCLVPQAFHNTIRPDLFDNTNTNFMFRLMPYYFGAGCCLITGTNVMLRARAVFLACKFGEKGSGRTAGGGAAARSRQLFSEVLVAEDVDLGSRIHALGYKSVFLAEVLAKGEVPHAPRDFWKQRARWAKAAHLYILDPHSVFWRPQRHMSLYQKALYCTPLLLHLCIFFTEPVMFTLPFICVVGNICPYGIDLWLWLTHLLRLTFTFLLSTHADSIAKRVAALNAQTSSRVLFFVNVKAVINTLMVGVGWKLPGAFKETKKAPAAAGSYAVAEGSERDDLFSLPPGSSAALLSRGAQSSGIPERAVCNSADSIAAQRRRVQVASGAVGEGRHSVAPEEDALGALEGSTRFESAFEASMTSRTELKGYDAYAAVSRSGSSDGSRSRIIGAARLEAVHASTSGLVANGRDGEGDTCAVPMSEPSTPTSSSRPLHALGPLSPPSSAFDDADEPGNPLFETAEREVGIASLHSAADCERDGDTPGRPRRSVEHATPPRPPPPMRFVNAGTQTPPPPPPPPRPNAFRSPDSVSIVHSASNVSTAALPTPEMLPTFVSRFEHVPPSRHTFSAPPAAGDDATRGAARTLMRPDEAPGGSDVDAQFPPRLKERLAARDAPAPQFATSYLPPAPLGRRASDPWLFSNKRRGASPTTSPKKRISGYARSSSMPHIAGSASVHLDAQTSHLALMRRAPSRHVWSSSLASESSESNALAGAPGSLHHGFPSALLAPPGVHDNIPEEEEVAVFFDPNTAHLTRTIPEAGTATTVGVSTHTLSESSLARSLGSPLRESDEDRTESEEEHTGTLAPRGAVVAAGPMPESAGHPSYGSPARISANGVPIRGMPAHVPRGVAPGYNGNGSMRSNDTGMPQPPPQWRTQPPPPMDDFVAPGCGLYKAHDAMSHVTEKRRACMPFEGTLDFPVLLLITALNLFTLAWGLVDIARTGELVSLRGSEQENVKMIALVFALVEATPGVLFISYMATYRCCRWTLWIIVPLVITLVALLVTFIEFRVGLQYVTTAFDVNWQLPDKKLGAPASKAL